LETASLALFTININTIVVCRNKNVGWYLFKKGLWVGLVWLTKCRLLLQQAFYFVLHSLVFMISFNWITTGEKSILWGSIWHAKNGKFWFGPCNDAGLLGYFSKWSMEQSLCLRMGGMQWLPLQVGLFEIKPPFSLIWYFD